MIQYTKSPLIIESTISNILLLCNLSFKESQLFCEGKIPALPHNFKPDTWVSGGNLPWEAPPVCQPEHLGFSGPFCRYCCFLFKKLANVLLPSRSPQRGQVAETPVHARACQAWHSFPTSQMAGNPRRFVFKA